MPAYRSEPLFSQRARELNSPRGIIILSHPYIRCAELKSVTRRYFLFEQQRLSMPRWEIYFIFLWLQCALRWLRMNAIKKLIFVNCGDESDGESEWASERGA